VALMGDQGFVDIPRNRFCERGFAVDGDGVLQAENDDMTVPRALVMQISFWRRGRRRCIGHLHYPRSRPA